MVCCCFDNFTRSKGGPTCERTMAQDTAGGLESCLKFLKGRSDEQRMVGLLLATKYVQGDDKDSILQVFNAMGVQFINRLLKSGVQVTTQRTKEQEEPYIQLAMSVLSAFCRLPELASSDEIIDKIPTLLDILRRKLVDPIMADCLECLLGIGSASNKGLFYLQESGALPLLMEYLSSSIRDSAPLHSSVKITQLILSGNVPERDIVESAARIMFTIPVLAERLSSEQGLFKLDILLLLRTLCSPKILVQISLEKGGSCEPNWLKFMRSGITQILQGQVVVEQKYLALELSESIVDFFGSNWLLGPMVLPGESKAMPLDRFFFLLVETLRVETVVLLNEVARSRFDRDTTITCKSEKSMKRRHILATCYALLESIINITIEEEDDKRLTDVVLKETVSALNEVISTVFEFLQEAKRQSITKGDDILASARLIGRYLADALSFQRNFSRQFLSMLEYLFTITSEHEESPFLVIQFLLPAISQITMEKEGCKALVSWGGHKEVASFMLKTIQTTEGPLGLIVKAGDIILNMLQKESRLVEYFAPSDFLPLLLVLPSWSERANQTIGISLAACICVMILDLTSEQGMLQWLSAEVLANVYGLIIKALCYLQRLEKSPEPAEEKDLWDLTLSACIGLIDRYPSLKHSIKSSVLTSTSPNSSIQLLLRSLPND